MNIGINDFIYESDVVNSVNTIYISPEHFIETYESTVSELERMIILRHIIRFNLPFIFKDKPLIFEQIRSYLSYLLNIEEGEILIIGSSKTGFSMSPKQYGKVFSEQSDVDFTLINQRLFNNLKNDFDTWRDHYTNKKIQLPASEKETDLWNENLIVVKRNLNRGFIDSWKLPNRKCCPQAKQINNAMSLINLKLKEKFAIITDHASARIYKDFNSFYAQLKLNIDWIIKSYENLKI